MRSVCGPFGFDSEVMFVVSCVCMCVVDIQPYTMECLFSWCSAVSCSAAGQLPLELFAAGLLLQHGIMIWHINSSSLVLTHFQLLLFGHFVSLACPAVTGYLKGGDEFGLGTVFFLFFLISLLMANLTSMCLCVCYWFTWKDPW